MGIMKGVILGINPLAEIVDITHDIQPQNLNAGAFVLRNSFRFFPPGTVHVVVVDPGVGSGRRILCVSAGRHYFVAPDNGVLKYIYDEFPEGEIVHITNSHYFLPEVSQTFHGRDIFAPVAAHLSKGTNPEALGPRVTDVQKGQIPTLKETPQGLIGQIVYVDRFGNLITNIPAARLPSKDCTVHLRQFTISGLVRSYFAHEPDKPLAIVGSSGYLEIALYLASAKEGLQCSEGDQVRVSYHIDN